MVGARQDGCAEANGKRPFYSLLFRRLHHAWGRLVTPLACRRVVTCVVLLAFLCARGVGETEFGTPVTGGIVGIGWKWHRAFCFLLLNLYRDVSAATP
jgi:hypothetical protein